MTHSSSTIDHDALADLAKHWIARMEDSEPATDQSAGDFAATLAGFEINEQRTWWTSDGIFSDGFDLGLRVAAAIINAGLGDPTNEIDTAAKDLRDTYASRKENEERDHANQERWSAENERGDQAR